MKIWSKIKIKNITKMTNKKYLFFTFKKINKKNKLPKIIRYDI